MSDNTKNGLELQKLLGQSIKQKRLAKKITMERFAEMIDISLETLYKIESGSRFVSASMLSKIKGGLGIKFADLFDFDPPTSASRPYLNKLMKIMAYLPEQDSKYICDFASRMFNEYKRNSKNNR
ncbi:MAG: helix-turn-helix transcriptional regulator [Pseudomonadota bacterium]